MMVGMKGKRRRKGEIVQRYNQIGLREEVDMVGRVKREPMKAPNSPGMAHGVPVTELADEGGGMNACCHAASQHALTKCQQRTLCSQLAAGLWAIRQLPTLTVCLHNHKVKLF